MPSKSANVKNKKQYEVLKDKGMSKQRAARIANSEGASSRVEERRRLGGNSHPGRHHRAEERPDARAARRAADAAHLNGLRR